MCPGIHSVLFVLYIDSFYTIGTHIDLLNFIDDQSRASSGIEEPSVVEWSFNREG